MDDLSIYKLGSFLTKADVACRYITNESIVKPRDEVIKLRLSVYKTLLKEIWADIVDSDNKLSPEKKYDYLTMSVLLVQGDIESQFISIAPVLYDRDSMIKERIIYHYNELIEATLSE